MGWVGLGFPHTAFQAALLMHKFLPPCVFSPWHTWSLTQPTLLGFIPASGNGRQFFWHTQRYNTLFVPTCKMQQTSPQVTELLRWFLFVLAEPQPLLELCCQMDFGGTFDSLPPRTPTARAELSQAWKPQHRAAAQGSVLHLCWETGNTSNCFHFFDFDFVNTSENRGHKEYPSSYICVS